MLIHCTKKLQDELKIKPIIMKVADEQSLFSWHANLLLINRRKTVVLCNDKNRYAIVLHGLKAKDFKNLGKLILSAIREAFLDDSIKVEIIDQFFNDQTEVTYAKASDRTKVARLNRACSYLQHRTDRLNAYTIMQNSAKRFVNADLVGLSNGDYNYPYAMMYKDLECFGILPVIRCKAVQVKVTLELEKHSVWRKAIVPLNTTFYGLHMVLQALHRWQDYHLHEFFVLDGDVPVVNLVCSEEDFEGFDDIPKRLDTDTLLTEFIPKYSKIKYMYDFGDGWECTIEVETVMDEYDKNHPICTEAVGIAPPEDIGGEGGYDEYLEALSSSKQESHNDVVTGARVYRDYSTDIAKLNLWLLDSTR